MSSYTNFKYHNAAVKVSLTKQDFFSFFVLILIVIAGFFLLNFSIPSFFISKKIYFLNFVFEFSPISGLFSIMVFYIFFIGIFSTWKFLINNQSNFLFFNLVLFFFSNLAAFNAGNLLTFYFFFELTSIPILYFIFVFGKRYRKSKASNLYLAFTLFGSSCMFFAIYFELNYQTFSLNPIFSILLLTIAFLVKLPIFPFYSWLPEAHVESPTIGSLFLAGISLKLGGYGFYKFVLPKLEYFSISIFGFTNLLIVVLILSLLFSSVAAISVHDFKKIVAYSSIAHMSLFTLNLLISQNILKIGGILGMISHSLTACSLFFIAGILYDKMATRNYLYMSGIIAYMPILGFFLICNIFFNISFPGSLAFVSEILIFFSLGKYSLILLILFLILNFFVAIFSFKLIKVLFLGNISVYSKFKVKDLSRKDFFILFLLMVPQIYFGLFPDVLQVILIIN